MVIMTSVVITSYLARMFRSVNISPVNLILAHYRQIKVDQLDLSGIAKIQNPGFVTDHRVPTCLLTSGLERIRLRAGQGWSADLVKRREGIQ
jgi:hypothetical protein